jgi:hypothetical protein
VGARIQGGIAQYHLPQDLPDFCGSGHPEAEVAKMGERDAQMGHWENTKESASCQLEQGASIKIGVEDRRP